MSSAARKRRTHTSHDGTVHVWSAAEGRWEIDVVASSASVQAEQKEVLAIKGRAFDLDFAGGGLTVAGKPIIVRPPSSKRSADEAQHGDTGMIVWDGAIALVKGHLEHAHGQGTFPLGGKRVLELGAGTGVGGLAAAALGAALTVITDLAYCLESLRVNVEATVAAQAAAAAEDGLEDDRSRDRQGDSAGGGASSSGEIRVEELDWTRPVIGETFDVVLGADIVWLEELVSPLVGTFAAIAGTNPDVHIILSHQQRSLRTDEALFHELKEKGFAWQKVPAEDLHPDFTSGVISIYHIRFDKALQGQQEKEKGEL